MNKRQWHHRLKPVRSISLLALVVLTAFTWSVAAIALRQNNVTAIELRKEVFQADESNGDVEGALQKLRSHVHAHMNTDLSGESNVYPPIQLKHTYDRLVAEEKERVAAANEKIYTQAQKYCERQNATDFSGRNRVPCIQNYVSNRGEKPQPIPDSLYKFDFASPVWSPDLAGWSLLAASFISLVLIVRIGVEIWARSQRI